MGRWTRRARRHGGAANIVGKRQEQLAGLKKILDEPLQREPVRAELAKRCYDWLNGNPSRVLSLEAYPLLGWEIPT